MKSTAFWVVKPYSSETGRRFGQTYHFHLQGQKVCKAINQLAACSGSLHSWLDLWPWRWRRYVPPKRRPSSNYMALQLIRPYSSERDKLRVIWSGDSNALQVKMGKIPSAPWSRMVGKSPGTHWIGDWVWTLSCIVALSRGYSGRSVNHTTQLHLVLRLRMRGDLPLLLHTYTWRAD
jgi:hypothetical protein